MTSNMFLSSEKELNFQEHAIPLCQKAWKKNVHLTKVQTICMFILRIWPRFKLFVCLLDQGSNFLHVCLTKVKLFACLFDQGIKLFACLFCAFDQGSNYFHVCLKFELHVKDFLWKTLLTHSMGIVLWFGCFGAEMQI